MLKTTKFDMRNYLTAPEHIAEYLTQVLEDEDEEEFKRALEYVAKSEGIKKIAEAKGMGRESLYKSFSVGTHPRFDTIVKIIHACGMKMSISIDASEHQEEAIA